MSTKKAISTPAQLSMGCHPLFQKSIHSQLGVKGLAKITKPRGVDIKRF